MERNKGFSKHEKSEQHRNSHEKWRSHKKILAGELNDIGRSICPAREEIINKNRAYFHHLFKYAIWFATNELPTRGHDETEDSNNPGNWLSFIKLQMEMNPSFSELHGKILKNSHHTFHYTSKTSLNGFFEVIADSIRQKICEEIRECGMFSILIDESKDQGKREELALVVRYYSDKVVERSYDIRMLTDFDAAAITEATKEVLDVITQRSNHEGNLASIGADGASVMSGEFSGVAECLRSEFFPWLVYIHCTAHRLNLMVNDLIKNSSQAIDLIQMINSLNTFLNIPKVRQVYENLHREMFPKQEVKYLAQQIDIRWGCKFEAIDLLSEKLPLFVSTMMNVGENSMKCHDSKHVE